jgi:hypothetical protein
MQHHMRSSNIVCYMFLQLTIRYEYSTTLILHKTSSGCIKAAVLTSCLRSMLFWPHNRA